VPNVLFVFVLCLVCSMFCLSLSCVLCAQCFVCLCPVSCVLNVLFVFVLYLVCSIFCLSLSCVLGAQCFVCLCPVSCVLNVLFVFVLYLVCPMFCLSLSCVLCAQCCQYLLITTSLTVTPLVLFDSVFSKTILSVYYFIVLASTKINAFAYIHAIIETKLRIDNNIENSEDSLVRSRDNVPCWIDTSFCELMRNKHTL
jgi:hypothetical protein